MRYTSCYEFTRLCKGQVKIITPPLPKGRYKGALNGGGNNLLALSQKKRTAP